MIVVVHVQAHEIQFILQPPGQIFAAGKTTELNGNRCHRPLHHMHGIALCRVDNDSLYGSRRVVVMVVLHVVRAVMMMLVAVGYDPIPCVVPKMTSVMMSNMAVATTIDVTVTKMSVSMLCQCRTCRK